MTWLKSYNVEYEEIKPKYIPLTDLKTCQKVVNKLTRHFKLPDCKVILFGRTTAYYKASTRMIKIPPKRLHLFLLLHELSHHWDYHANPDAKKRHTKKQRRYLKRLYKYSEKKGFWGLDQ